MITRPYEELEATLSPEVRQRAEELARLDTAEMVIREVRGEREAARAVLARAIGVDPADLLQVEREVAADLAELEAERGPEEDAETRLATLERRVEALGATLHVTAVFPQGEVVILPPKKAEAEGARPTESGKSAAA